MTSATTTCLGCTTGGATSMDPLLEPHTPRRQQPHPTAASNTIPQIPPTAAPTTVTSPIPPPPPGPFFPPVCALERLGTGCTTAVAVVLSARDCAVLAAAWAEAGLVLDACGGVGSRVASTSVLATAARRSAGESQIAVVFTCAGNRRVSHAGLLLVCCRKTMLIVCDLLTFWG